MKVYKVVYRQRDRRKSDELVSAFASGSLRTTYRVGEWSEAPVGGLLCFKTLECSRNFLKEHGAWGSEVWEAEGEHEVPLPPAAATKPDSVQTAETIWQEFDSLKPYLKGTWNGFTQPWPEGTVAFRRLKLVRFLFRKSLSDGRTTDVLDDHV